MQDPKSKIIDKSEDIILTLKETKRLSKLVKDLMLLARADSNNLEIKKEPIEIDKLIKEIVIPYQEMAIMQEKALTLNLNYGKTVLIDRNKIHEVLIILLDNALKYTEKSDTIEICSFAKDSKYVLEIKDSGIGISDEGIKQIFNRFYREDKARSRQTGGSGLGLAIANEIIALHNGTIKINHNTPKGIIVTIKLGK